MNKVKVSFLIPVHNCEEYIEEAVISALNQTFASQEIIVINDGSTDGTLDILQKYSEQIRIINIPHGNQAIALNVGIKNAIGEYICYLDADDCAKENRAELQSGFLDENPEYGIIYSGRDFIDSSGSIIGNQSAFPPDDFRLLQYNYIPRSSVMQRKCSFEKVGFLDELNSGNDDWDMWIKVSEQYKIGFIRENLIKYRIHPKNISKIRPNRLNYYRLTKMNMLWGAFSRNKKSVIIFLMFLRAKISWKIGKVFPKIGENAKLWSILDKILDALETIAYKIFFNNNRRIST